MSFRFRLPRWRSRLAAACLVELTLTAGASERVVQALRESLPHYDPSIRAAAEAQKAAESARKPSDVAPEAPPATPKPSALPEVVPGVVVLDPVEVKARRQIPRVNLPRIVTGDPIDSSVETEDPYLSPAERRARLQKKHLSTLDRALNKFSLGFGLLSSGDARAADAEQRERFTRNAGQVADAIQLAAVAGESEEELKKLRELYLQMLVARPK